nr:hypothetical protein [Flavobacterium covae]
MDFRIYEIKYKEKNIVLFVIPAAKNEPVDFLHTPYIRIGSITRKLMDFPEKERKIWQKLINHSNLKLQKINSQLMMLLNC